MTHSPHRNAAPPAGGLTADGVNLDTTNYGFVAHYIRQALTMQGPLASASATLALAELAAGIGERELYLDLRVAGVHCQARHMGDIERW